VCRASGAGIATTADGLAQLGAVPAAGFGLRQDGILFIRFKGGDLGMVGPRQIFPPAVKFDAAGHRLVVGKRLVIEPRLFYRPGVLLPVGMLAIVEPVADPPVDGAFGVAQELARVAPVLERRRAVHGPALGRQCETADADRLHDGGRYLYDGAVVRTHPVALPHARLVAASTARRQDPRILPPGYRYLR
jgi:hypothetical protein